MSAATKGALSLWDWLWLECLSCHWRSSEGIRRGTPLVGFWKLGPCSCRETARSFLVLERRDDRRASPFDVQALRLPVVT